MMTVKTELAQTLLEMGQIESAKKEITDLQMISKDSMANVRQIVQSLKDHNLNEELLILKNMLELAGIRFNVINDELIQHLPSSLQAKITMILRELATNIVKHSHAETCKIIFNKKKTDLLIDYEDDGVGFEEVNGHELHSIKERLIPIQGQMTIISKSNPTNIQIRIPMEVEI
ncbi:hypothetical protein HMPREF9318_00625 [Streptococcus urinalis FB127-CNA-2]|uniref:ATPase/histidine kinase/DNA gyrase B/HSP90 domain protein n=2 Tax=Streptococcus urinalis TaxID=149016 RepID=G5KGY7_9STRE|nr:ATPase/histidine kinase/DNA gyrase B/HSP90 domain protein [Streptococcus urinalis 2285-97]EKS22427.1 hypothetical protein HMPREF9318_00625 [Streptococcus urinalis FB127-CNA-2]VEF32240.1 sensor histidine kinase [Streptococcus urinalis]